MNPPAPQEMLLDRLCAACLAVLITGGYILPNQIDFTLFPPLTRDPASPSEQFVAAGGHGIDASDWAAACRVDSFPGEAVAGALASDNSPRYPTPYLSSQVSGIPPDYLYGAPRAESGHHEPGVDVPTQLPLVSHPQNDIVHRVGGGITESAFQPCSSPYYTGGYPSSSSATPNRNHTPYQPSGNTAWASGPTVAREGDLLGVGDLLVFSPPGRVENRGTIRPPKGSPPSVTRNVAHCNPKKRKRQDSQDKPRKGKHSRSQHQIGRSILSTPSSPSRPSELRIVQQINYEVACKQEWDKLDDIVFTVRGRDGIALTQAMDTYFNGPDDRDLLMFTNGEVGGSISFRINFEGYETNGKAEQIPTSNYKEGKGRITKKRLAEYTAKRIKAYLEKLRVGGTPCPIRFEDMILTRLIHVSKGSFQPEIWHQITPSGSTNA